MRLVFGVCNEFSSLLLFTSIFSNDTTTFLPVQRHLFRCLLNTLINKEETTFSAAFRDLNECFQQSGCT